MKNVRDGIKEIKQDVRILVEKYHKQDVKITKLNGHFDNHLEHHEKTIRNMRIGIGIIGLIVTILGFVVYMK